jgi:hypothetical protein
VRTFEERPNDPLVVVVHRPQDKGKELLLTAEINTKTGLCVAVAFDTQTSNRYLLVTR